MIVSEADLDISNLRHFLSLLQSEVSKEILNEGDRNRVEYVIGLAFCMSQHYIAEKLNFFCMAKSEGLNLGPTIPGKGKTFVSLVNDAANWWKHLPEWSLDIQSTSKMECGLVLHEIEQVLKINKQGTNTHKSIMSVATGSELYYPLSEVLFCLASEKGYNSLDLQAIGDHLHDWSMSVWNDRYV